MRSRASRKGRATRPEAPTRPAADTRSVDQATREFPDDDPEAAPRGDDPAAAGSVPPGVVPADPDEASEAGPEPAPPGGSGATPTVATEGATPPTPVASPPASIPADGDGDGATPPDRERGELEDMLYPEVLSDLTLLAGRINASIGAFLGSYRTTMLHAFRVGQYLLQAKKLVKPGGFTAWIEANCRGISVTTAREYMRAVKKALESKRPLEWQVSGAEHQPAGVSSLKEFLKQSSKPRARRPVRRRTRAISGEAAAPQADAGLASPPAATATEGPASDDGGLGRPEPGQEPCPTCGGRGYLTTHRGDGVDPAADA